LIEEEKRGKSFKVPESSSKMRVMRARLMPKKILMKMVVTAVAAVRLRTVLTARNPLRRLTSPAEMFQKLAL
jgi:hypothetical protein